MIKTDLTKSGITVFTLVNDNGMEVDVIELGATITSIRIPKGDSKIDVVLGYDDLSKYRENPCFFGSVVGPVANRTQGASFQIDGVRYQLPVNEGKNNLHTDFGNGLHKRMFSPVINFEKTSVCFTLRLDDMEYGLPGNREITVSYSLTEENELCIEYKMISDKKTACNMTNHTYFNLGGHDSGLILDEDVQLLAGSYTPITSDLIPKEIASVAGTPFDFTETKKVGKDIKAEDNQLKIAGGYDHNFVIGDNSKPFAYVRDNVSGISMEVETDLPGVQFYTGNNIGTVIGKGDVIYRNNSGLCLETQFFPNSLNDDRFKSPVIDAGESFTSTTKYRFRF